MRVLLLVNATASSVTARKRVADPQAARRRARGRGGGDVAARARDPARARGRERRLRRRRGARRRRHAQRGGRRPARTPTPRSRRSRAARRTCTRSTLGYPARRRSTRPTRCSTSLERALVQAHRRRAWPTAAASSSTPGIGFDAAVIRRVERYGELKRYASHPLHVVAAFDTWFRALRPQQAAVRHRRSTTASASSGVRLRDRLEDDAVHLPRAAARSTSHPNAGLDTRSRSPRSRRSTRSTLLGGAASAMRTGKFLAHRARTSCTADDLARATRRRPTSRSRTRSTATTSATSSELDIGYEPDALDARRCPDASRRARRARRRGRW